MSFEARQEKISKLLNDVIYKIPRNQRRYVWNKENWKDLWDDTLFASTSDVPHFLGSIVLKQEEKLNGLDQYTIIDGQQRLMTITIFLTTIMFVFKKISANGDFEGSVKYFISRDNKNEKRYIYESENHSVLGRVLDSLFSMSYKEIQDIKFSNFLKLNMISPAEDKNILDALDFFHEEIHSSFVEPEKIKPEKLVTIRDALLEMNYVRIQATTDEDSYTIFEILNARGQTLFDHDLLKNYIMRYIFPIDKRDDVKKKWESMELLLGSGFDSFIKHYAPHRFSTSEELRKQPYKNIRKSTNGKDINKLLSDIELKSKYYDKIQNPTIDANSNSNLCSTTENKIFSFFRKHRQVLFRPVILSLMHQHEKGNITIHQYDSTLFFLYNFFICFILIGNEKSNRIADVIYKYAPLLENNYSEKILIDFLNNLKEKIPNEAWFRNAFINIGYSNYWSLYKDTVMKKKTRLVLDLLETSFSKNESIQEYTIEHVYPDSQKEDHAKIGNLLPLEEDLNLKCANLPLDSKIKFYQKSNFVIVKRMLERYDKEGVIAFDIEKRTAYLADFFYHKILNFKI